MAVFGALRRAFLVTSSKTCATSSRSISHLALFDRVASSTRSGAFAGGLFQRFFAGAAASALDEPLPAENTGPASIRDFAIIAHVDHGKTTLLDQLLRQCGDNQGGERVMDSMSLEKERGITIAAKYTSLPYRGYTLNAVDTPGHADFGGEVERVLGMVDGCLLLVDATEGPLAQTKFVLQKALTRGLRPMVVLNKVDRPTCTPERCLEVETSLFDLFALLGASDDQLDFPVLYASAREGWASSSFPSQASKPQDMTPLLDAIVSRIPPPSVDPEKPFQMLVSMMERDPFLGRLVTGRINAGRVRVGDRIEGVPNGGLAPLEDGKVTRILKRLGGLGRVSLEEAEAGDIVSVAGLVKTGVTDTVAAAGLGVASLPATPIDTPTIKMVIGVNDSPLAGKDGTQLTGSKIGDRLTAEAESNVSITVAPAEGRGGEAFEVQGRGELQLGVLIETMRREGFELSVSPPAVLYRADEHKKKLEPIEDVIAEINDEHTGLIVQSLNNRKAELLEIVPNYDGSGRTRLVLTCPSRGLIGYRAAFSTETQGTGVMHRSFRGYEAYRGPMDRVRKGVLVSMAAGETRGWALAGLEARGVLFVGSGEACYDGMIIGESSREEDLEVNPAKTKHLTNVRSVLAEDKCKLQPPRKMTLEEAIGYVAADELIEVTPKTVRLRKKYLGSSQRRVEKRRAGA